MGASPVWLATYGYAFPKESRRFAFWAWLRAAGVKRVSHKEAVDLMCELTHCSRTWARKLLKNSLFWTRLPDGSYQIIGPKRMERLVQCRVGAVKHSFYRMSRAEFYELSDFRQHLAVAVIAARHDDSTSLQYTAKCLRCSLSTAQRRRAGLRAKGIIQTEAVYKDLGTTPPDPLPRNCFKSSDGHWRLKMGDIVTLDRCRFARQRPTKLFDVQKAPPPAPALPNDLLYPTNPQHKLRQRLPTSPHSLTSLTGSINGGRRAAASRGRLKGLRSKRRLLGTLSEHVAEQHLRAPDLNPLAGSALWHIPARVKRLLTSKVAHAAAVAIAQMELPYAAHAELRKLLFEETRQTDGYIRALERKLGRLAQYEHSERCWAKN